MPQVGAITNQPGDTVDLHHSLDSDGTTYNQGLAVRCFITDPDGTTVTGSPFTLTHEARGSYVKRDAYTVTKQGTYREEYFVYTTYPTDEELRFGHGIIIRNVRYEGAGNVGGGVDPGGLENALVILRDKIPELVWRYDLATIKNAKTAAVMLKTWIEEGTASVTDVQPVLDAISKLPQKIEIPELSQIKTTLAELYGQAVQVKETTVQLQQTVEQTQTAIKNIKSPTDYQQKLSEIKSSVDSLAGKNTQVIVDIERFLTGVQKVHTQATRQIVNQLSRKIDQRTDYRGIMELLEAVAQKKPDYSEVIGYLQDLNEKDRERLAYAVKMLSSIIRQGAKVKIDLQQVLTDKRRAYAMAGDIVHNLVPAAS